MCGICGIYDFSGRAEVKTEQLKAMNGLIIHRGPDDEGYYCDGTAGLAMRRLSIIDLSTGHQPISNENKTVWLVFNGEIYNFQELRRELEAKGHRFQTKSDTETIAHLYEEHGKNCVTRLRGMFAFALWDIKNKIFLLARDRIGKKPLNYAIAGGKIAFASELRALLALDFVSRDIDYRALDMYLSLQYIPSPISIYKSIQKLPPAHILTVQNGKAVVERYWDLPVAGPMLDLSVSDTKALIADKLKEAVKIRMISDVPLGAFLSGGIDSSVIVALMSELSNQPVKTFSVGFEEQEFSELHYAREVADMYDCDHHEFIVKPEMADILPKLAWHYSEPYADSSALPSYYVAKETRRHVTVALNGDGGDENFAGYLRYMAMKIAHYWDYLPAPLRSAAAGAACMLPEKTAPFDVLWRAKRFLTSAVFSDFTSRHLKMISYFHEDEKEALYSPAMKAALAGKRNGSKDYIAAVYKQGEGLDFINKMLFVDIRTYLPECLMAKVDIATMANSLEGRSPLLDHEFMEMAFKIRGDIKLKGFSGAKWIFKEAFKHKLPKSLWNRSKMGFGIPVGPWFRGRLKNFWQDHCLSETALGRGYFDRKELFRFWDEHQSGKRDHGYRLWALLMLELWHETYENDSRL